MESAEHFADDNLAEPEPVLADDILNEKPMESHLINVFDAGSTNHESANLPNAAPTHTEPSSQKGRKKKKKDKDKKKKKKKKKREPTRKNDADDLSGAPKNTSDDDALNFKAVKVHFREDVEDEHFIPSEN